MPLQSPESGSSLQDCQFLLVDDEKGLLDILTLYLRHEKACADVAVSVEEALQQLQSRPASYYQVVICDQNLPDGDGSRLLEPIRQAHPDAVIILMSGFLDGTEPPDGFSRLLQKPVSLAALRQVIVEELDKRAALTQEA